MAESSQSPQSRPDEIHWGVAYLREDLQDVRQEIQRQREETQKQFQQQREETQKQFQQHREETQKQFQQQDDKIQQGVRELRQETQEARWESARQFRWLVGLVIGLFGSAVSVCIAIVKL